MNKNIKEINTNYFSSADELKIPENYKNDLMKAMKIGYYKNFYKQGLISADELEKLIAMQDNKILLEKSA